VWFEEGLAYDKRACRRLSLPCDGHGNTQTPSLSIAGLSIPALVIVKQQTTSMAIFRRSAQPVS